MADSLNLELESNAEEYELSLGDDSQRYLELTVEDRIYEVDKGGDPDNVLIQWLEGTITSFKNSKASKIGKAVIYQLDTLKRAEFSNVTAVANESFYFCSNLEEIILPEVLTVGSSFGCVCPCLTSVSVPKLKTIGRSAFSSSTSLTQINLPSAEKIDGSYFCKDCSALTSLVLSNESTVCKTSNEYGFLLGTPIKKGTGYIYVPDALVDSYKAATGWKDFASQIKPLSELPSE